MSQTTPASSCRKIMVLVVHGVGEQRRFEQLETIAANFFSALKNDGREPIIELHYGKEVPRNSPEHSMRETPVSIRWKLPAGGKVSGESMEASFREVHWADLDMPLDFAGWWRFVGWSLGISGVRFFCQKWPGMRTPTALPLWRQCGVRITLFLLSLIFLILFGTVGLLDLVLKRLSIRIKILEQAYGLFFDYLGDVKLYQDWFVRQDARAELIGEKSRIAVRRRMVRALLQTASEALDDPSVEGFYICAHSLGTVISFNALMEIDDVLPDYLSQCEWEALSDRLKTSVSQPPLADRERPTRRPWLDPYKGGYAAINRAALFEKFRGLITLGSPLDRFGAIWPAIVPINNQGVAKSVPWINVFDVQDPVAGGDLSLFEGAKSGDIGGLQRPVNIAWPDRLFFFRAHNSYWVVSKGKDRLMNAMVRWVEGAPFVMTDVGTDEARRRGFWRSIFYRLTLVAISVILLAVFAILIRAGSEIFLALTEPYGWVEPLRAWLKTNFATGSYLDMIPPTMLFALIVGVVLISACSLARRVWEVLKFGPA